MYRIKSGRGGRLRNTCPRSRNTVVTSRSVVAGPLALYLAVPAFLTRFCAFSYSTHAFFGHIGWPEPESERVREAEWVDGYLRLPLRTQMFLMLSLTCWFGLTDDSCEVGFLGRQVAEVRLMCKAAWTRSAIIDQSILFISRVSVRYLKQTKGLY